MLLRDFIKKINQEFEKLVPGIKTFGIAQSVVRTVGSEEELLPGIVGKDGEITYVGIDDVDPVRIYHRIAGLTTTRKPTQGYGESLSDIINTYQMVMVVFLNNKATKLYPEELFLYLQSNIPDGLKAEPYKTVFIRTTNVILNSQVVFRAEYVGTAFKLPEHLSLFQINYVIESTLKKECFAKCPEDC